VTQSGIEPDLIQLGVRILNSGALGLSFLGYFIDKV